MAGDANLRAVHRLARELDKEPAPELDWDRVERSLMASISGAAEQPTRVARRRIWPTVAGVVALTAAAAAVAVFGSPGVVHTPAAVSNSPNRPINGDALLTGAVIIAKSAPVIVEHSGRASWTLEPHGRARLVERGKLLTIALDQGAVVVRVVPHAEGEPFAVEAGITRIAAHGTHFRVERVAAALHVDVSEGIVAVGANKSRGHTHGFSLPAPSRGAFGLDGASGTVWSATGAASVSPRSSATPPVTADRSTPRVRSSAPSVVAGAPASPSVAPSSLAPRSLERVPTIAEIDDGLRAFQVASNQCFTAHTEPAGNIRVTVHVMAVIDIAASGQVGDVVFEPPLAPQAQRCVEEQLAKVRFAASRDGVKIERTLEFTR